MTSQDLVIGIDLGTTNSAVSLIREGTPILLPVDGEVLLPSAVGLGLSGELLVGRAARNQALLYPERTVLSVKRQMGEQTLFSLGEQTYSPTEISAMILLRLKQAAESALQQTIQRAVITVPAYFSDAQRSATKEAGEIAGLRVERILHEPTAAALCYFHDDQKERRFLVYDLGGGTFDVSIVGSRGKILEVLASHGDTRLGGDDFDALLSEELRQRFIRQHGEDPFRDLRAKTRLVRAAETAKIRLSTESFVKVQEEHLLPSEKGPLHLDEEVSRRDYEELIEPLLERTQDSVQKALREAGLLAKDLDDVILVGGSSRTPRVQDMLRELLGIAPRIDVNPEHAVAFGAAIQAARLHGDKTARILVDVTPFSFGTSHLGILHDEPSIHCYRAIIRRNTPLPTHQSDIFHTISEGQEKIEVNVFQGEDKDARNNHLIGSFQIEDLDTDAPANNPIVFELRLDLNGILQVQVTEKHTGHKKMVTIENAFRKLSEEEISKAQTRLRTLLPSAQDEDEDDENVLPLRPVPSHPITSLTPPTTLSHEQRNLWTKTLALVEKAYSFLSGLEAVDRKELEELMEKIMLSMKEQNWDQVTSLSDELADILFYLE